MRAQLISYRGDQKNIKNELASEFNIQNQPQLIAEATTYMKNGQEEQLKSILPLLDKATLLNYSVASQILDCSENTCFIDDSSLEQSTLDDAEKTGQTVSSPFTVNNGEHGSLQIKPGNPFQTKKSGM